MALVAEERVWATWEWTAGPPNPPEDLLGSWAPTAMENEQVQAPSPPPSDPGVPPPTYRPQQLLVLTLFGDVLHLDFWRMKKTRWLGLWAPYPTLTPWRQRGGPGVTLGPGGWGWIQAHDIPPPANTHCHPPSVQLGQLSPEGGHLSPPGEVGNPEAPAPRKLSLAERDRA